MTDIEDIAALDLGALLCSKVCHDIISPVGAVTNGLEVLEEDSGEEMREFAFDLIKRSARQASAKLQFCRIAFGAAGSAGAEIDLGDAELVAKGYMESEKSELDWDIERAYWPKNRVKLLLNMLLVAITTIPRGGTISLKVVDGALVYRTSGLNSRIPSGVEGLMIGERKGLPMDAHSIQPIYTGLLADASSHALSFEKDGDEILLIARPIAA